MYGGAMAVLAVRECERETSFLFPIMSLSNLQYVYMQTLMPPLQHFMHACMRVYRNF